MKTTFKTEYDEWLVPPTINNCLNNNFIYLLDNFTKTKKQIFTSKEIRQYFLENTGFIVIQDINNSYTFYKYVGLNPPLISNNNAYYKNGKFTTLPSAPGTYYITNYTANNKELYSITLLPGPQPKPTPSPPGPQPKPTPSPAPQPTPSPPGPDASSSYYISSSIINDIDLKINISLTSIGASTSINDIINDLIKTQTLDTVIKYYNFTVNSQPLSESNNYTISGFTLPHWESSNLNLYYYGALSQIDKDVNVIITIDSNVILPFGLSNLKITNITSTKPLNNKLLYLNSLTNLGNLSLDLRKDSTSKSIKDVIVNQSSDNCLGNITIHGGGIIYGGITSNSSVITQLGIPRYNTSINGQSRADIYMVSNSKKQNISPDTINSIQYWILGGLLEINAKNITIDNISVVGGIPRGQSATQLNAYNINNYTTNDRTATISNSEFVLNTYSNGQADGLDSLCINNFTNLYIQAIDDCFKIGSNTTASDITILSGTAGGAINVGAYGYNKPITNNVTVSNIYLHELTKNQVGDGCNHKWPGPSVIFVPYYPTVDNTITAPISINNIYYPVGRAQWKPSGATPFFTGGFVCAGYNPSGKVNHESSFTINISTDISLADDPSYNYIYSNMEVNRLGTMNGKITVNINRYSNSTSPCSSPTPANVHPNQSWNGSTDKTNFSITYKPSCNSDNENCTKCIDLLGGDTRPGGIINIWNCNQTKNQQWLWKDGSTNIKYYTDQNKCIDLLGGNAIAGNKIGLWECNGTKNQEWLYDTSTNQIRYKDVSSMCIDVPSGITTNGTQLQLWNCN